MAAVITKEEINDDIARIMVHSGSEGHAITLITDYVYDRFVTRAKSPIATNEALAPMRMLPRRSLAPTPQG